MYTAEEKKILDLKPGITDWASLTNFDQYLIFTKSEDPDEAYLKYIRPLKLKLQLFYRYNNSLLIDMKIILWTAYKVICRSNRLPKEIEAIVSEHREKVKVTK